MLFMEPYWGKWADHSLQGKRHVNNVKAEAKGSRIANHSWSYNHDIVFENAFIIDKGNFRVRKFLDFWHIMKISDADNNSCLLPREEKSLRLVAVYVVGKFLDDNKLKTSL